MVSGCDRELNADFYNAASLKYHGPDTWHDSTPSHIILTLGRPVLALPRKSEWKRGTHSNIFKDFRLSQPGLEPTTCNPDTVAEVVIICFGTIYKVSIGLLPPQ